MGLTISRHNNYQKVRGTRHAHVLEKLSLARVCHENHLPFSRYFSLVGSNQSVVFGWCPNNAVQYILYACESDWPTSAKAPKMQVGSLLLPRCVVCRSIKKREKIEFPQADGLMILCCWQCLHCSMRHHSMRPPLLGKRWPD
jgi:hypothetical protein